MSERSTWIRRERTNLSNLSAKNPPFFDLAPTPPILAFFPPADRPPRGLYTLKTRCVEVDVVAEDWDVTAVLSSVTSSLVASVVAC